MKIFYVMDLFRYRFSYCEANDKDEAIAKMAASWGYSEKEKESTLFSTYEVELTPQTRDVIVQYYKAMKDSVDVLGRAITKLL